MEKILNVANYIADKYHEVTTESIDEMKLHKLLYFTQRECIAITGEPAFSEPFEGWQFGPVNTKVRRYYLNGDIVTETQPISDSLMYIANNVIDEYGGLAAWKLSELSHKELSWRNSRKGLGTRDYGNKMLSLDDIRKDAEKVRPYDHVWDMYYDEFEDEVVN